MRTLFFLIVLYVFVVQLCFAQIPATLSYQGLLTDNAGVPVADGSYAVTFSFYTAPTGGTAMATRGPLTVSTFKGLFTITLGDGTTANAALPFTFGDQELYVGITVSPSTTELLPRVRLTAVPYAFVANTAKNVDGSAINSGTISATRIADGSVTNAKLASGIDASKLTGSVALENGGTGATTATAARTNLGLSIGTNVQAYDADLDDLADGTLTGSKVDGSTLTTVNATNITAGTLALANGGTGATNATNARSNLGLVIGTNVQAFDTDLTDLADGTLSAVTISLTGTDASKLASGTTVERPGAPVEGQIRYNFTEKVMEYYNGTNWYFMVPKVIILKDVKSNGTQSGTFTAGAWQTRDLNTIEGDNSAIVSLNSNQFTLSPGEYIIEATAPVYRVESHKIKLRDVTTPADVAFGSSEYTDQASPVSNSSRLFCKVTITGSNKAFEIQHYCSLGAASNGFGPANSFSTSEVFTQVKITKLR